MNTTNDYMMGALPRSKFEFLTLSVCQSEQRILVTNTAPVVARVPVPGTLVAVSPSPLRFLCDKVEGGALAVVGTLSTIMPLQLR
jgi:hypothetical protein